MENHLNFCPKCGSRSIDPDKHGSPGIGVCRDCGTIFSVLSVNVGEKERPTVKTGEKTPAKPRT